MLELLHVVLILSSISVIVMIYSSLKVLNRDVPMSRNLDFNRIKSRD